MKINSSKYLYNRAKGVIPGGVNSPVRAFKSVGGTPLFISKAKGSILTDVDGNEYIDLIASWGPMILGHAHKKITKAIAQQIKYSTSFGAPTELEVLVAELITDIAPNVDKVRMVNSGTEACMSAIRLARGYTKRDKVIKFEGCYHGHSDSFLINAGSGAMTLGTPSSPGVTKGTAADTLTAKYNDLDDVRRLLSVNKNEVAAIILEPVCGNMGCVLPREGFLQGLRDICNQENIVLIFDEVMTGFRLAPGGAQEYFGVDADLVTYGKIIGGGMPVGAFGGKSEIMQHLSPEGSVYQAGTLSGNPVAMIAGYTMLKHLRETPKVYKDLQKKTKFLAKGLNKVFKKSGFSYRINYLGSMINVFFTDNDVVNFETAAANKTDLFAQFFHAMLRRGVYLPPSPYESYFLANSLKYSHLSKVISAAEESLKEIKQL